MNWLDLPQAILAFIGFLYFYKEGHHRGFHQGHTEAWEVAAKAVEYDWSKDRLNDDVL